MRVVHENDLQEVPNTWYLWDIYGIYHNTIKPRLKRVENCGCEYLKNGMGLTTYRFCKRRRLS